MSVHSGAVHVHVYVHEDYTFMVIGVEIGRAIA
jgi:hypothetical protein